jgi:uncharacterized protein YgiM (DUF1202 family)
MTTYRVTASSLNLREGPGTNHSIVAALPQHKILEQFDVSEDSSWYRVRTTAMDGPAVEGWVSANHVVLQPLPIDQVDAPWLVVAEREMGVIDAPGTTDNPRIAEYLKPNPNADLTDEEAWCSAFVNWCIEQARLQGTGNAKARVPR